MFETEGVYLLWYRRSLDMTGDLGIWEYREGW